MLRYTSCLFATVVFHSYHHRSSGSFRTTCYHHLFLSVTILSILYHCTRCARVGLIDRLCAHAAFAFVVLYDSLDAIESGVGWVLIFPLAVLCLWIGEQLLPERAEVIHALLHLVSVIGANLYLGIFH